MQLCQIHFYQKIARKKVARVNAALDTLVLTLVAEEFSLIFDILAFKSVKKSSRIKYSSCSVTHGV